MFCNWNCIWLLFFIFLPFSFFNLILLDNHKKQTNKQITTWTATTTTKKTHKKVIYHWRSINSGSIPSHWVLIQSKIQLKCTKTSKNIKLIKLYKKCSWIVIFFPPMNLNQSKHCISLISRHILANMFVSVSELQGLTAVVRVKKTRFLIL